MAEGGDFEFDNPVFEEDDIESVSTGTSALRHELLKSKVDDFYDSTHETPDFKDYNNFQFDKESKHLLLKTDGGTVQLTKHNNPREFLKLSTIKGKIGVEGIRRHLSLSDYSSSRLPKKAVTVLQNVQQTIPNPDAIELNDLSRVSEDIVDQGKEVESTLSTINEPALPMREILALNQALQTIKGELLNNVGKLSQIDTQIEIQKKKLADLDDLNAGQEVKDRVKQRIRDLNDERKARLDVIKTNRTALRSQVNRMKETIETILYENTTLAERIRTLFREQGVTLATLITAVGFAISTLVLSLTGGSAGGSASGGGGGSKQEDGFVKRQLLKLKDLLMKLGNEAVKAIPGIIGSVVGWLFKTAGEAVSYIANHIWLLFLMFIAGLLELRKRR